MSENRCDRCDRSIEPSPFPGRCWSCVYYLRWQLAERRLRFVVAGLAAVACAGAAVVVAVLR